MILRIVYYRLKVGVRCCGFLSSRRVTAQRWGAGWKENHERTRQILQLLCRRRVPARRELPMTPSLDLFAFRLCLRDCTENRFSRDPTTDDGARPLRFLRERENSSPRTYIYILYAYYITIILYYNTHIICIYQTHLLLLLYYYYYYNYYNYYYYYYYDYYYDYYHYFTIYTTHDITKKKIILRRPRHRSLRFEPLLVHNILYFYTAGITIYYVRVRRSPQSGNVSYTFKQFKPTRTHNI